MLRALLGQEFNFSDLILIVGHCQFFPIGVIIWTVFHLSDILSCSYLGEKFSAGVLKDACVRV